MTIKITLKQKNQNHCVLLTFLSSEQIFVEIKHVLKNYKNNILNKHTK